MNINCVFLITLILLIVINLCIIIPIVIIDQKWTSNNCYVLCNTKTYMSSINYKPQIDLICNIQYYKSNNDLVSLNKTYSDVNEYFISDMVDDTKYYIDYDSGTKYVIYNSNIKKCFINRTDGDIIFNDPRHTATVIIICVCLDICVLFLSLVYRFRRPEQIRVPRHIISNQTVNIELDEIKDNELILNDQI